MRLPDRLRTFLFRRFVLGVAANRAPDVTIGGDEDPYLKRWHVLPRNPLVNVYVHKILRSDDDSALHDHPWPNCSIVLTGEYREHSIRAGGVHVRTYRLPGDIVLRRARTAHRVELIPFLHSPPKGQPQRSARHCWTLFITGPRVREWGFHCPSGWRPWREFTNPADGGRTIGKGCE